jgi:P27 family predicted phage terminase small subunit
MIGTRGPYPKPPALRLLEGGAGKRPLNLADGVNPRIEVPSIPKHLCPEARKEWKRITPILEELGLISGLDRAALALYCQAVGRLSNYESAFAGMIAKHIDTGKTYDDAVLEASQTQTPSGYVQQSVIVNLIKSSREQVNRQLMHFGMSPAARGRVTASNNVQLGLPGIESAPAPMGFGRFAPQAMNG